MSFMDTVALNKEEYIPARTGANITFHLLQWDKRIDTFSLKVGGNINYHSLKGATVLHTHEFPEIFLVLSGEIRHFVNGELRHLPGGTMVFVRPSDVHRFEQFENESCELVNFAFSLGMLRDFSEYVKNDFFLKKFTAPVTPPTFKLSLVETEQIAFELLKINTCLVNSVEMARIKIKAVLAELFIKFFLEKHEALATGDLPEWFEELLAKMRQPRHYIPGLAKMQALANCTPEHLCKCFRKYLDKSPTEFINELRINHAARQLMESNEEIFAIASDLNFKSLSRFYHVFKRHYGISPAKYRVIARKNDIPL